jgi:hypothetical protein
MSNRGIKAAASAAMLLVFAATAKPAHAQLGWSAVGVGDFDTGNVYLVLGGLSVSPQRAGWSPIAGVSAYWLQYPTSGTGSGSQSVVTVTPTIGLKDNFHTGDFSARVGYSFSGKSGIPIVNALASGSGVVNEVQVDYWGTGAYSAQGIADYNYGSSSFWGRGRFGVRFAKWTNGSASIGPELTYLHSDTYSATRYGGVLGISPGLGTQINAAVGRKNANGANADATYFTFELVLYPH